MATGESMESIKAGSVGDIETAGSNWGFTLSTAGKPVCVFAYTTKEEARTARTAMQIAVELASAITPSATRGPVSKATRIKRKALRVERRAGIKGEKSRKKQARAKAKK
jgi:hypothetical protein